MIKTVMQYIASDGKTFETYNQASDHEDSLKNKNSENIKNYMNSYNFKKLEESGITLSTYGIWKVHGEDSNCDMGGYHHEPYLGTFKGKFEDVLKKAFTLPRWGAWAGYGRIEKIEIEEV